MTSTESTSRVSEGLRTVFGVVLLTAWVLETILWVYSAIHYLGAGDPGPAIRGACALLLMVLAQERKGLFPEFIGSCRHGRLLGRSRHE